MKTKIIFIIVGILFTSVTAFAFSDLTNNHTYNEAINFIKENNIVQGYPDGTFKPDNKINRAELLKIIIESKFSDDEINNALNEYRAKNYWYIDLQDVDIDSWYGSYVRIAIREGITEGYPDGTFKPSQNVNFVEALKIVLKTYNIAYTENTTPWYKGLVEKGAELNLNPLDITRFDLNITRAQMADMITRIVKMKEGTLEDYLGSASVIKQDYDYIKNGESNVTAFLNRGEISNENDEKQLIPYDELSTNYESINLSELFGQADTNCYDLLTKLDNCEPYSCYTPHMLDPSSRVEYDIIGKEDDNCILSVKNDPMLQECSLTPDGLMEYTKQKMAFFTGQSMSYKSDSEGTSITINGIVVENIEEKECVQKWLDPEMQALQEKQEETLAQCKVCEFCNDGKEKLVTGSNNGEVNFTCMECTFDSNCIDGYECSDENKCIKIE